MKALDKGQLALAAGVGALGLFIFVGAWFLPDAAGYSTVGPALVPKITGAGLVVLAAVLAWEVWQGGFRNHDEAAERALPMDWEAFAWLTGALIAYGLLIEWLGFIPSSVILFVAVARAFGSRHWEVNAGIALVLAVGIFATFNYGLGLSLPKGILKGIL